MQAVVSHLILLTNLFENQFLFHFTDLRTLIKDLRSHSPQTSNETSNIVASPSSQQHNLSPPQHQTLSPISYTHQIPSPITNTPSISMNNNVQNNKYNVQKYLNIHQQGVDGHIYHTTQQLLSPPSSYSPEQSPNMYNYGIMSPQMTTEHDIKQEPIHSSATIGHHNSNQHKRRSPLIDENNHDEDREQLHELEPHHLSRQIKRPTVLNVKQENDRIPLLSVSRM